MNKRIRRPRTPAPDADELYHQLLTLFYDRGDRDAARPVAAELEAVLATSPALADSIRGDELRSVIAEVRGDYAAAARSREAEIRKILQLHSLAQNGPNWAYVSRQYDFADVSDRLDLLAILYDRDGDSDRAIATLEESRRYAASHNIPFDGQDLLDELATARTRSAP